MIAMYLEDFETGQTLDSGRVTVTEEEIIHFATQFDPQPFHLDPETAKGTFFRGLAASGWHTAALTMRLLVDGEMTPANGIIGAGFETLNWPRPVRPGDALHVVSEVLEVRPSESRPMQGMVKVRSTTLNQNDEVVQDSVGSLVVMARPAGAA